MIPSSLTPAALFTEILAFFPVGVVRVQPENEPFFNSAISNKLFSASLVDGARIAFKYKAFCFSFQHKGEPNKLKPLSVIVCRKPVKLSAFNTPVLSIKVLCDISPTSSRSINSSKLLSNIRDCISIFA